LIEEKRQRTSIKRKLIAVISMMKPLQLTLLSITMYGAYIASGAKPSLTTLALLSVTGVASIGGVTALNMILDRDIDSLMERTRKRPLVTGEITPKEATAIVTLLILAGIIASARINAYVALSVLGGLYFDIIMYTELAKRRTALNILLGGIAGGMPALGGWAAGRGQLDLGGAMLAGVVMAWIPMHIWFISYYYRSDYVKAGIPMASVVLSPRQVANLVKLSLLIMNALLWGFTILQGYGYFAALATSLLTMMAGRYISSWSRGPSRESARMIFKFASPIMAIVFILLPIDYWVISRILW